MVPMSVRVWALSLLLLAACASGKKDPNTGDIVGTPEDQRAYAGIWRGTMDGVDDRMDGPIEFRLDPGITLFLTEARIPRRILWVRLNGPKLTGAIDSYYDPVRKIRVYTTFETEMADGTMR